MPRDLHTALRTLVLLAAGVGCLGGCGSPDAPLHGKWEGQDPFRQTMQLEFLPGGQFRLKVTGANSFQKQGTYRVDFSQSPAHLDLDYDGRAIRTIVELRGGDTLVYENTNSSDQRPTRFGDDQMTFTRLAD